MKANRLSILFLLLCCITVAKSAEKDLIAWKFKTTVAIHATPLIEDTVLYVGSTNNVFYAINIKDGSEIWHYSAEYSINSKATVNDSLVIFESGFKLFALDKKNGALKWDYVANNGKPEMSIGFTDYHHSSPVIYKDVVYFGDGWGNMNGVDVKSGSLKFQYTISTDSAAIRSTPAILDDVIYFGDWAGHVYAVSLTDKSLKWSYTLEKRRAYYGMVTSDMVIRDTLLYFGSQHDVFSPLDIKTGKPAWTFIDPNKTYLPSTPVFYDNSVIIGSTINTFKIYCLTEGKVKWSCGSDGIFFVHPVIVDSVVIMNTSNFGGDGTMFMVNAKNGHKMSEYHFKNAAPASPVVGDNKLFVGNGDGFLYAFNLEQLLYPKDDSSAVMDTASTVIMLNKNDKKLSTTITIENVGIACDSFVLVSKIKSEKAISGITLPSPNAAHISIASKRNMSFSIDPTKLDAGKYAIEFSLTSKRHPEIVLTKTFSIEIADNTAVEEKSADSQLKVYPNPARNYVNFEYKNQSKVQMKIEVYSLNGKMVYSFSNPDTEGTLVWNLVDMTGKACKAGAYIYNFITNDKQSSGILTLTGK